MSRVGRKPIPIPKDVKISLSGGKVQVQEVLSQASYYSVNDQRLHYGLGAAATADLEIRWPNGAIQKLPGVKADQFLSVKEP